MLPTAGVPGGTKQPAWITGRPAPATRFVRAPGLLSAECVERDGAGYLAVTTIADPADPRTDAIGGDVQVLGRTLADWGLHLIDMNLAQDDLIALVALVALVARQSAAWASR